MVYIAVGVRFRCISASVTRRGAQLHLKTWPDLNLDPQTKFCCSFLFEQKDHVLFVSGTGASELSVSRDIIADQSWDAAPRDIMHCQAELRLSSPGQLKATRRRYKTFMIDEILSKETCDYFEKLSLYSVCPSLIVRPKPLHSCSGKTASCFNFTFGFSPRLIRQK